MSDCPIDSSSWFINHEYGADLYEIMLMMNMRIYGEDLSYDIFDS